MRISMPSHSACCFILYGAMKIIQPGHRMHACRNTVYSASSKNNYRNLARTGIQVTAKMQICTVIYFVFTPIKELPVIKIDNYCGQTGLAWTPTPVVFYRERIIGPDGSLPEFCSLHRICAVGMSLCLQGNTQV